jgi:hypothetical protein
MNHWLDRVCPIVAALGAASAALAQVAPRVSLQGVTSEAAFDALAQECYEAGMLSEMPSGSIMDCGVILEERSSGVQSRTTDTDEGAAIDDTIVVRHKIRFTLIERAEGLSITADPWTQIEELGIVLEEPIESEEYVGRVEAVLNDVGERLRARAGAAPWAGRYESEQAFHLDAHLRSVSRCEENLPGMSSESVGRQLESVGIWPLSTDTRDRCEQLNQYLFEWGLVRGNAEPTVDAYASYRAALPPERRPCSGRLALPATCR